MSSSKLRSAVIFAVATLAVALSGCGGSTPAGPRAGVRTPAASNADSGGLGLTGASTGGQAVVGPAGTVQRAIQPRAGDTEEHEATAGSAGNACALVSRSEAQSILGRPLSAVVNAPLGPTCVFKLGGAATDVTVAVEQTSLYAATHLMTKPHAVSVRGHRGYCGVLGAERLFVEVDRFRVVAVSGPCSAAQRFAAIALGRLA